MKKSSSTSRALTLRVERALTAKEFLDLADVPPEVEWFANITNRQTRRAYQNDLRDFMHFAGIRSPEEFRVVTRAHLIAWRKDLEGRAVAGATIRRKLSAVSSLFEYLCERNAVVHNPVKVDGNQLCDLGHATQTMLFYRDLRAMAQSKQSLDIGT